MIFTLTLHPSSANRKQINNVENKNKYIYSNFNSFISSFILHRHIKINIHNASGTLQDYVQNAYICDGLADYQVKVSLPAEEITRAFKVTIIASEVVKTTFVLIFQEKILGSRRDQTVL